MSNKEADWHGNVMFCSFVIGLIAVAVAAFCIHLVVGLIWIGSVAIAFACAARECQKQAESKDENGGNQ